jgi:hypothetical protein
VTVFSRLPAAVSVIGAMLLTPATVRAQAWVSLAGEGTVSVVYHHVFVEDHFFSKGERRDRGHVRSHTVTFDFDYGITDRLSLRVALPYVSAKYNGTAPHRHAPDDPTIDDGSYHGGLQDVRTEARYIAREFPIAITPFVTVSLPTHDYEFFGHSAIGLNLRELQVGTYGGLLRPPFYVQGRYGYSILQRVLDRRRTRSLLDIEAGWQVSPGVRVFGFQTAQVSHSGLDLMSDRSLSDYPLEISHHHDQISRVNSLALGSGMVIQVSDGASLHGAVLTMVAGRNGHATKYGVSLGVTWMLGRGASSPHHAERVASR